MTPLFIEMCETLLNLKVEANLQLRPNFTPIWESSYYKNALAANLPLALVFIALDAFASTLIP